MRQAKEYFLSHMLFGIGFAALFMLIFKWSFFEMFFWMMMGSSANMVLSLIIRGE